ncbi:Uncharacterised protein [uncultured archaeon]|nr:Uncharacterised protein [uncultured archaeon]
MAKPQKKTPIPNDETGMNRDLVDEEGISPELGSMDTDRERLFATSKKRAKKKK